MNKAARQRMFDCYDRLQNRNQETAIKFTFTYNKVSVKIYFDSYIKNEPNCVLVLNYARYSYVNCLNIYREKQYLAEIPRPILNAIRDENNTLIEFYKAVDNHIEHGKYEKINYGQENSFEKNTRLARNRNANVFIKSLRHVKMSKNIYRWLVENRGVDKEVVDAIKKAGFTVVRTNDVNKHRDIVGLHKAYQINIKGWS